MRLDARKKAYAKPCMIVDVEKEDMEGLVRVLVGLAVSFVVSSAHLDLTR